MSVGCGAVELVVTGAAVVGATMDVLVLVVGFVALAVFVSDRVQAAARSPKMAAATRTWTVAW
ncbi:MAG: hypothetical protein M3083_19220 [Actinomycetota bacterium]|nr:hypothetical protein [Actinomycetota bacterium]